MRYLLLVICIAVGYLPSARAQRVLSNDTLFRPDTVRLVVNYIAARNDIRTIVDNESQRVYKTLGRNQIPKPDIVAKWGTISDFVWAESWCQYRKLTKRERYEMFTLRLKNFPELQRYSSMVLNRDVGKVGFGFHLQEYYVNDYQMTEKGTKASEALIDRIFSKRHVKSCWAD